MNNLLQLLELTPAPGRGPRCAIVVADGERCRSKLDVRPIRLRKPRGAADFEERARHACADCRAALLGRFRHAQ